MSVAALGILGLPRLSLKTRLMLVLGGTAVAALSLAVGALIGAEVSLPRVVGLEIAVIALPLIALYLELGTAVYLAVLWGRVSDVAIQSWGAASIAVPLGVGLFALWLIRRWLDGYSLGWGLVEDLRVPVPWVLLLTLSTWWAKYPDASLDTVNTLVKDVLVFWILVSMIRTPSGLRAAVAALVVVAGFLSFISLDQYFTNNFASDYGGFAQSAVLNIVGEDDSYRLGGPLNSPNFFALILAVTVPLGMALLRTRMSLLSRLCIGGLLIPIVLTTFLTFSRGGALILGLVTVVALLRHKPRPIHGVLLVAACAAVVVLAPSSFWARMGTLLAPVDQTQQTGGFVDDSTELRLGAQQIALTLFFQHPILGVGTGNYQPLYPEVAATTNVKAVSGEFQPHNRYLEILSENGVVGMIVYGWMVLYAWRSLRRARSLLPSSHAEDHDLREVLYGIEVAFFGYLAGQFLLQASYDRYFWMILALVLAGARVARLAAARHRLPAAATYASNALSPPVQVPAFAALAHVEESR